MKIVIVGINSKYIHTMLSVRYLAASINKSLQSAADSCCVYREFSINMSEASVLESLYNEDAEVYCFSTYIFNVEYVLHTVKNLKKIKPKAIVVLGGPEVSYENESLLRNNPEIDFISCGEGESSLPLLISALMQGTGSCKDAVLLKQTCATAFIYNNEYISFPLAEPICDLDTLPFPYTEEELCGAGTKILYYESSRGCPFGCSYCLSSADTRVRFKTVAKTCEELAIFIKHKVRLVKFVDRTFNADRDRAEKIVEYIIRNDNGVTSFHFEVAPWLVTDNFVALLKGARSGLFQLEIGIQSTHRETLSAINRKVYFDNVCNSILKLKESSVHIHVDLIAGLPYETFEIFGKSFDDVMALECDCLQLGFLKMLKGTSITHQDEHLYIYEENAPYQVLSNKYISYSEICRLEKISAVLDLYLNSGLCTFMKASSLKCIFGAEPFEFYSGFAEWLEGEDFFEVLHSTVSLFEFIYRYLSEKYDDDKAESLVAFEYYRFTGSTAYPSWLRTMPDKHGGVELINDDGRLQRLMSEKTWKIFNSADKKHWYRKSHLVTFKYDENGEKKPRTALFLYSGATEVVFIG